MKKILILFLTMPILILFFYVDIQQNKGIKQIKSSQLQQITKERSIKYYGSYEE